MNLGATSIRQYEELLIQIRMILVKVTVVRKESSKMPPKKCWDILFSESLIKNIPKEWKTFNENVEAYEKACRQFEVYEKKRKYILRRTSFWMAKLEFGDAYKMAREADKKAEKYHEIV